MTPHDVLVTGSVPLWIPLLVGAFVGVSTFCIVLALLRSAARDD